MPRVRAAYVTATPDAAVAQLRGEGHEVRDEDIARLSPAQAQEPQRAEPLQLHRIRLAGGLRPLRDPDAPGLDDDEDDDGAEDWPEGPGRESRPGGTSLSGRNGWTSRLDGTRGPRCRTGDEAKVDLAARRLRVVTAVPRRP